MSDKASERRMIENELVFRHHNENIQKSFDELIQISAEEGQGPVDIQENAELFFYCECSDENCQERVPLTPKKYNAIHKSRKRFVVLPGHEVKEIEKIIEKNANYCVVEKNNIPALAVAGSLNETDVDNTSKKKK